MLRANSPDMSACNDQLFDVASILRAACLTQGGSSHEREKDSLIANALFPNRFLIGPSCVNPSRVVGYDSPLYVYLLQEPVRRRTKRHPYNV